MVDLITYDLVEDEDFRNIYRVQFRLEEKSLQYAILNSLFIKKFESTGWRMRYAVSNLLEKLLTCEKPEIVGEYGNGVNVSMYYCEQEELIPSGLKTFENDMFVDDTFNLRDFEEDLLKFAKKCWTHRLVFDVLRTSSSYFNEIKKQIKKFHPDYTETSWNGMQRNEVLHKIIKPSDLEYILPGIFSCLSRKEDVWFSGCFMEIAQFRKAFNSDGYLVSTETGNLVAQLGEHPLEFIDKRNKIGKMLSAEIANTVNKRLYQFNFYDEYVEMKPEIDSKSVDDSFLSELLMAEYFKTDTKSGKYIFRTSYAIAENLLKEVDEVHYGNVTTTMSFRSDSPINTYYRLPVSSLKSDASNWVLKEALLNADRSHSYTKEELISRLVIMCVEEYVKYEKQIAAMFDCKLIKCTGSYGTGFSEYIPFPNESKLDANTKALLLAVFVHKHLRNNTIVDSSWENDLMDIQEIVEGLILDNRFFANTYFIRAVGIDQIIGEKNVNKNS